jgi:hypothetical protein
MRYRADDPGVLQVHDEVAVGLSHQPAVGCALAPRMGTQRLAYSMTARIHAEPGQRACFDEVRSEWSGAFEVWLVCLARS